MTHAPFLDIREANEHIKLLESQNAALKREYGLLEVTYEEVLKDKGQLLDENAELLEACKEALGEIVYWHKDMLSEHERNHPRGSGWARVHDRLVAVIHKGD